MTEKSGTLLTTRDDQQRAAFVRATTLRWFEPVILGLLGPVFLFGDRFSAWLLGGAVVVLATPWLLRRRISGSWSRPAPASALIVLLLGIAVIATVLVSFDFWSIGWPPVATLLWSVAVYFAALNWRWSDGHDSAEAPVVFELTVALLLLGLALALVGVLGLRNVPKIPVIGDLAGVLPSLSSGNVTDPGTFHGNRIGGALTLLAPLAVALTLGVWTSQRHAARHGLMTLQSSNGWRAVVTVVTFAILLVLLLSQSRGAWLGVLVGVIVVLLLGGKWSRILFGVGAVATILIGVTPVGQNAIGYVQDQAALWRYSQSGLRLTVWQSTLEAIRDFPLTGVGLGGFDEVVNTMYALPVPGKGPNALAATVDFPHAHNQALQTALDVGLIGAGLLAAAGIVALLCLVMLVWRSQSNTIGRYWAAGMLGSLIAFLVFGLVDAFGLGERPGFVMWFFLGVSMAAWSVQVERRADRRFGRYALISAVLALGGLTIVLWMNGGASFNLAARAAVPELLGTSSLPADALAFPDTCRALYYRGALADADGDAAARDDAWAQYIACAPDEIELVQGIAGANVALATHAVETWPDNADALFWLGRLSAETDPDQSIALYQRGLQVAPASGYQWSQLGALLQKRDPEAAIDAFMMSCVHGDPPGGGCRAAGRIAEQQGDIAGAIAYYEQSPRAGTRALAEPLAIQLRYGVDPEAAPEQSDRPQKETPNQRP